MYKFSHRGGARNRLLLPTFVRDYLYFGSARALLLLCRARRSTYARTPLRIFRRPGYWERDSIEFQVWLREFEMRRAPASFTHEKELDRNDAYFCRDDLVRVDASIASWQLKSIDHSFNYAVKLSRSAVKCTFLLQNIVLIAVILFVISKYYVELLW